MKKILTFLIILMVLVMSAWAFTMPHPIYGVITNDGLAVAGLDVKVKNLNTGVETTVTTNLKGFYQIELGNVDVNYRDGDAIRVSMVFCEGLPVCTKTVAISGGGNKISFDISGYDNIPEQQFVCEDGTVVTSSSECISSKIVSGEKTAVIEMFYGQVLNVVLADNKLAKLLDSEVKFNGEWYDVSEELSIVAKLETSIDDVDYGLNPYLVVDEVRYEYFFDDVIDITDITIEDTLTINLSGQAFEIKNAKANEITFLTSKKIWVYETTTIQFDNQDLQIGAIGDDFIVVTFNGETNTIYEGNVDSFNGYEVYVDEANQDDSVKDFGEIRIGTEVEVTVEHGDEYDENWDWIIDLDATPQVIGYINHDPWDDLDDKAPLKLGDKISLPNDFIDIQFSSITSPVLYDLEIEVDGSGFIVEGKFTAGSEDYTEIFVDSTGIYDEDMELISADKIQVGDSNIYLEAGSIIIGELIISDNLDDVTYKGVSYSSKDENFLTETGLIFEDPENAILDKKRFRISVPQERPEVKITIGDELADVVTKCQDVNADIDTITCDPCEVIECATPKPCPEVPTCDDAEEGYGLEAVVAILSLLIGGGLGIYTTRNQIKPRPGQAYRIRWKRNGEIVEEHYHKGNRSYHDINTKDRDVKERHPRGERFPIFKIDSVGDLAYVPVSERN